MIKDLPDTTPEQQTRCYMCSLTERRWMCPYHRRLYTFRLDGGVRVRNAGEPAIFELKSRPAEYPRTR